MFYVVFLERAFAGHESRRVRTEERLRGCARGRTVRQRERCVVGGGFPGIPGARVTDISLILHAVAEYIVPLSATSHARNSRRSQLPSII